MKKKILITAPPPLTESAYIPYIIGNSANFTEDTNIRLNRSTYYNGNETETIKIPYARHIRSVSNVSMIFHFEIIWRQNAVDQRTRRHRSSVGCVFQYCFYGLVTPTAALPPLTSLCLGRIARFFSQSLDD